MKWRENHSHDKVLCACDDGYETPADKLNDKIIKALTGTQIEEWKTIWKDSEAREGST
jgi:hypothetical protein